MAMCFSRPQPAMIPCHSAIERPYFISIEGKYDAGPCFGHGADCPVTVETSRSRAHRRADPHPMLAPPSTGATALVHSSKQPFNGSDQTLLNRALITTLFFSPAPNGVKDNPHSLLSMATSVEMVTASVATFRSAKTESGLV
jgi:hypothetical protein